MPWPSMRAIRATTALLSALGAPLAAQTRHGAEWRWAGIVSAGHTVTIDAVRARVRVLPARGDSVEISGVLRGRHDAPEGVVMRADTAGGSVVIRTRYPSYRALPQARRDECLPSDTLHGDFWHSDVRAELTLHVPPGVRVAVRLMWGDIDARAVRNPMDLETQNGSIEPSPARGRARRETNARR